VASTPWVRSFAYSSSTMSERDPTPSPPPMTRTILLDGSMPRMPFVRATWALPTSVVRSPDRASDCSAKSRRIGRPLMTILSSGTPRHFCAIFFIGSDAKYILSTSLLNQWQ